MRTKVSKVLHLSQGDISDMSLDSCNDCDQCERLLHLLKDKCQGVSEEIHG